ncbi:TIGR03086 family metal-binding protein [Mycolicibacterium vinylchloridicum]|uniref:TIGR03086 family metal-binding protein n=1 Tax=Mycolicibacterium vinylchloridicum TaxID=2736928 RepID=UPI0015C799B0|nr:TIGR03086 family metal-binding protein [Mycolicibacterium vinylchloridicum]
MDPLELLKRADARLVGLTTGLGGDDLDLPSPCSQWNVRSLLSHTVASIDAFAAAVDGGSGPTEQELFSGTDILGADPLAVVERAVARSQRAWATITDWQAPVASVLGVMPAGQAMAIVTYSTLLHSWDLAVALNRPLEFDDAEAELAEAVGTQLVPPLRQQQLFGAEVRPASGATPTQRVVAFSGRSPI